MKASVSQIKIFKACRRAWYFQYVEKLEPVHMADSLRIGKQYHAYLEMLEHGEELPEDPTKECAMAHAFQKYILPQINVVETEKEIEAEIGSHILHGFVDGLQADGTVVEHKTTSSDITEGGEYEFGLLWDEQILAYMFLTGTRKIVYTVCKKPTIRQKKDESEEEFYQRMIEWYDTDTDQKIRLFSVERTDEEVEKFRSEFWSICEEMESTSNLYKNCLHCNSWGRRCEYSSICLNYDSNKRQEYIGFIKHEKEG